MTKYYPYGVSLSKGQLEKLSRAYNNNSAITIRLARNELSGPYELMLTKNQINKLKKAMSQGTGSLALSGLASLGVDKIFGKGQRGDFLIPMDKIAQLVATSIY